MKRREFLGVVAGLAGAPLLIGQDAPNWGGAVVDCHCHLRRTAEANITHLDGCGVSNAYLLAGAMAGEQVKAAMTQYPGRFLGYSASTDVTKPEAEKVLTDAVKNGATAVGELKSHVEANGPEMRRMYALCAELSVPILIHFQEVSHTPTEGVFNTGVKNFEVVLKANPKTRFVGHADAFWANVSADYANDVDYPKGPIKRGGITDKMLADYANLYGDISANSGNNALSRDPEFTGPFLARHQDKLVFGSDCSCTDGKGGGISQNGNPGASRLAGKCVARETLTVVKGAASPAIFKKITWVNGHAVYKIKS